VDVAIILSIISLIVSGVSAYISVANYRRNNPKLAIRSDFSFSLHEPPTLTLHVTNVGHQPTTLIEAGFRVEHKYKFEIIGQKDKHGKPVSSDGRKQIKLMDKVELLSPGDMKTYTRVLGTWPDPMIHADFPLRAYAISSHGNTCWGYAIPILRRMVTGMGMKPRNIPSEALKPLGEEPEALPIYPMWKLWKPLYLRTKDLSKQRPKTKSSQLF
jgi:hypothetical protein